MTSWRYIADDGVTASFGLAADEVITRRQGKGESPPTLRLYTYRSHCALAGRFQRVTSEFHLDYCRSERVAVNRRPTGGGAIIMGADQLAIAVMVPEHRSKERSYERTRELFQHFSRGIIGGLKRFGVSAEYRRKNDVEVNGKKIAGMGISFDPAGGLLFHTSLLVDMDIPFMLQVLKTPFEKISDKEIATVAERMTTVRREANRQVSLEEVREQVREAFREAFDLDLVPGDFTDAERAEMLSLERERYLSPEWIDLEPTTPDSSGSASLKTDAGLLSVHLTLAGDTIKAIYITGDFFADEAAVAAMERSLRWHPAAQEAVQKTLTTLAQHEGVALPHIPPDVVAKAIEMARAAAKRQESAALAKGCFVNP
jgi:lipoate-protein ligase A